MKAEYNIALMIVLALDTATRRGSAALWVDGACDHALGPGGNDGPDGPGGHDARTHAERLPGALLDLLAARGLTLQDVDRLAVVSGPGSFTGLRVGIAAMQGLALATGRLVSPVPTLEAMAEGWRLAHAQAIAESARIVVASIDGQRGEVFFAAWRVTADTCIEHCEQLIGPSVGPPDDVVRAVRACGLDHPGVIVGIDLDRHAGTLQQLGRPIVPVPQPLADVAAGIAARRPELAVAPHALRPLYIRRPDAEVARERAGLARP